MRKHCAQLAQLVEQRTENPCVSGSIPELGILIYYGILAQVVEHLTFNQVVRGSNPRCLIRKRKPSLVRVVVFFFYWYIVNWIPDNVVGRGARRPGDVCSARTEAERRPNPRCLIIQWTLFFWCSKNQLLLNSGQHILISKTAQKIIENLCMFVNTFRGQGDTIITVKTPQYIIYFLLSP